MDKIDIQLYKSGVDQTLYKEHNEWQILSAKASREIVAGTLPGTNHSRAIVQVHLRRNAIFYVINYVLPSVIIAVLSLLVFLIPPEVGKRMGN